MCCGQVKRKNEQLSMFRFPSDKAKKEVWLRSLGLSQADISVNTRICSRHFLNGNSSNIPAPDLGKRFASPKKLHNERSSRAIKRLKQTPIPLKCKRPAVGLETTPSSSRASSVTVQTPGSTTSAGNDVLSASAGEQYLTDYNIHELPSK